MIKIIEIKPLNRKRQDFKIFEIFATNSRTLDLKFKIKPDFYDKEKKV